MKRIEYTFTGGINRVASRVIMRRRVYGQFKTKRSALQQARHEQMLTAAQALRT